MSKQNYILHQTSSWTYINRYPAIFSACRKYFNGKENLNLLSYGCSTGEEVITLRHYFPKATIIGADINRKSLETCRNLDLDDRVRFVFSSHDQLSRYAYYDAIFCMAVFQRDPHKITVGGIRTLKDIYPFERFEWQIIELTSLLRPHGLLVVHYAQYALRDTVVAFRYKPLGNYRQYDYRASVFDRDSNLIHNPDPPHSIYVKLF